MTALYIILGILLVLFLLSLLRLGVRVEFAGSLAETRVAAIAGPARIQLLPKPEKPEKPQKEKKKKEKPAKAKAEGSEKKKKLHLTKEDIKTALPALWECLQNGLRKTRQRLLIDPLHLSASLPGAADPAGAAELYGYVNAGMWTVMPQLERLMRIPNPRLHVEADFDAAELRLTGEVGVTLQIRDLLAIGLAFAKPVLRWYLAMQKRHSAQEKAQAKEKGAAPKEHDTADRTPSGDGADHITT